MEEGSSAGVMKRPAGQDPPSGKKTKMDTVLEGFVGGIKKEKAAEDDGDEDDEEEGEEEEGGSDDEEVDPDEASHRSKANRFNEEYKKGTLPPWAVKYYETLLDLYIHICFSIEYEPE